jgi:hypothetical protein
MFFLGTVLCASLSLDGLANISIINGLTHEKKASPGETYDTIITIQNSGEKEVRLKIYQADFSFDFEGNQYYTEAGKLERSNAAWLSYYPRNAVIPAGEIFEAKCQVNVPSEAALIGTYWSLIMIEPLPEADAEKAEAKQDEVSLGITQGVRYAVQIITHIQDTGTRQINFLNTEVLKKEGKKFLQVDVENTGERWLKPVLYVEIYNNKGEYVGKFEGGKWRIYPGTSVRYRVDLTHIPPGEYKALILVDNLDEHVFGTESTFNFAPCCNLLR